MSQYDGSYGFPIHGVKVTDTRFMGVSCLDALERHGLIRPSILEKIRPTKDDPQAVGASKLRRDVQRRFDFQRKKRAKEYARYMEGIYLLGRMGSTPPITIWTQLARAEPDNSTLLVKYSSPLVAVDGETQLEARYIMRVDHPETGNIWFPIDIHFNVSEMHGRQILHDYNRYAHPVTERQAVTQNMESPLSMASQEVLVKAGIQEDEVSRFRVIPAGKEAFSIHQVMCALIGCNKGHLAIASPALSFIGKCKGRADSNGHLQISETEKFLVASLLRSARGNKDARKASIEVWTAAGVLAATGRDPDSYRWSAVRESLKYSMDGKRLTGSKAREFAYSNL